MDAIHICSSCGEIYDDEISIRDISRWRRSYHSQNGAFMEHKCAGGFPQAGHFNAYKVNPAGVVHALKDLIDVLETIVAWDEMPPEEAKEVLLKVAAAQAILEGAESPQD